MKVTKEHYEEMKSLFDHWSTQHDWPGIALLAGYYREQGCSPRRFRWDILWRVCRLESAARSVTDNVLELLTPEANYDDKHIDTALRKYMHESGLDWAATK